MAGIEFRLAFDFYRDAQTIYSAHSPFVFDFFKNVINVQHRLPDLESIEQERIRLKHSKESISFIEYGAGTSYNTNSNHRKIRDIARHSLSGKWQCRILYNLISHYKLMNVLEVGTSLGISTAYLGAASPEGRIITLEGNPASVEVAKDIWKKLGITNIEVFEGEFGATLPKAMDRLDQIDMGFLDGNHRKSATLEYYEQLEGKINEQSVLVVDDIYWSREMNEAWEELKQDDKVAFSIDLFRMGILFFDQTIMPKQHFKLIPFRYKPWAIGLFG